MAALAVGHLGSPGLQRVLAVAGVAVGRFDFLTAGVDAPVGTGLILLLFGQMAVAAELGDLRGRGDIVGRNIAHRGAVLLRGAVADAAVEPGFGMAVRLKISHRFGMTRRTPVRLLSGGRHHRQQKYD